MWWVVICVFFFFKQKTAYEMRISDWSSDVCSSDLWTAEFFATNLFNTVQVGNLFRGIGFTDVAGGGGPEITSYKPPRMYGVREIGRASCRERVCQYV